MSEKLSGSRITSVLAICEAVATPDMCPYKNTHWLDVLEPKVCDACRGTGRIKQRVVFGPGMIQEIHQGCQYCSGLGKSYKFENEKKEVTVEIEPGMSNDTKIRFQSYGDDIPNVENGDIVFCFDVQKHDNFARKGDNLFVKLTIALSEALTGCCFDIKHLDNRLLNYLNWNPTTIDHQKDL